MRSETAAADAMCRHASALQQRVMPYPDFLSTLPLPNEQHRHSAKEMDNYLTRHGTSPLRVCVREREAVRVPL